MTKASSPKAPPKRLATNDTAQTIARALARGDRDLPSLPDDALPARTITDHARGLAALDAFASHTQSIERAVKAITNPPALQALDRAIAAHAARPSADIDAILVKATLAQKAIDDLLGGRNAFTHDQLAAIARVRTSPAPTLPAPSHPPRAGQRITGAADLGRLVRDARRKLALTQQDFADLAGVGRRFVSELESGKPSLEIDRVLKCCAAAGIDVSAQPRGSA